MAKLNKVQTEIQVMGLMFHGAHSFAIGEHSMEVARVILPDALFGNCATILEKIKCFDLRTSWPDKEKLKDNNYIGSLRLTDNKKVLVGLIKDLYDIAQNVKAKGHESIFFPDNIMGRAKKIMEDNNVTV